MDTTQALTYNPTLYSSLPFTETREMLVVLCHDLGRGEWAGVSPSHKNLNRSTLPLLKHA